MTEKEFKELETKTREVVDQDCLDRIKETLQRLRFVKPDDRSEKDRRYAVAITELEKVYAYFDTYVIRGDDA